MLRTSTRSTPFASLRRLNKGNSAVGRRRGQKRKSERFFQFINSIDLCVFPTLPQSLLDLFIKQNVTESYSLLLKTFYLRFFCLCFPGYYQILM